MKPLGISLGVAFVLTLIGCGFGRGVTVTGSDGSKATVSKSGDKVTIQGNDGKGGQVKETFDNNSVKVESSNGSMSMGGDTQVTEADLGLTFYPGSTPKPNTAIKMDMPDGASYSCIRETTDDPAKVIETYRDKIKAGSTMTSGEMAMVSGNDESGGTLQVMATKSNGKTEIQYTHVIKKKK